MNDTERNIAKLNAKRDYYNRILREGYRTPTGVPFGSVSVDRDVVKRELDNINRNLERITPKKFTGFEENKERERLRKEAEILRENMLSKNELMGVKTGRIKTDGHAHDTREAREEDVRKQIKFDREFGQRKIQYDKDVENFNYRVGDNALPKSEQIRRGGKEY
jgi:hypothetical protein